MKHVNGHLAEPRAINPSVPEGINAVTMRLLAKSTDERYGSAAELIEDLERILDGLSPTIANGASRTATTRVAAPAGMAATRKATPTRPVPPHRVGSENRRKKRRWLPLLALLVLLAAIAGVAYAISQRDPAVPQVEVPDLIGLSSIEEAQREAGENFQVVQGDGVESEEPRGSIVDQDPEPGEEVDQVSRIEVDVVETRVAALPDVTDQTEGEARRILEDAGFGVEVERRESEAPEEGQVLEQDPEGGDRAAVEPDPETVTLTVGSGPATAAVPDLSGSTESEARSILGDEGFRLGEVTSQPNDTVPEGQIFAQDPQAGVEVREGGRVNVVVSTGPELFPVPDVTGDTLEGAQATLEGAGFVLGSQTEEFSDEVDEGRIISQDPAAGGEFRAGTAVNVVVSAGPEEIVVPNVVGQDWIQAAETLQAEGLRVFRNVDTTPSSEPENTVLATDPAPGTQVERGTAVRLTTSSGPPEQPGNGGSGSGSSGGASSGSSPDGSPPGAGSSGGGSNGPGGGGSGGSGSNGGAGGNPAGGSGGGGDGGGDSLADQIIEDVTGEED